MADNWFGSSARIVVTETYKECLKNQAVDVGGHALDGCQVFIATGVEGTPEALICAACGCNKSFHRREVQIEVVG